MKKRLLSRLWATRSITVNKKRNVSIRISCTKEHEGWEVESVLAKEQSPILLEVNMIHEKEQCKITL